MDPLQCSATHISIESRLPKAAPRSLCAPKSILDNGTNKDNQKLNEEATIRNFDEERTPHSSSSCLCLSHYLI